MDALPRPELTVRAVAMGMPIGALLTPCNVYSGPKIGWSFNMSIAAGLAVIGAVVNFAFGRPAIRLIGCAAAFLTVSALWRLVVSMM